MNPRPLVIALLLLSWIAPASAQRVRIEGASRAESVSLLREVLGRNDYLVIARDTVLPKGFRTPGDLIVLGSDVRLEGEVQGSVAVVGGEFFVRPGAVVHGRIADVSGGVYPSGLARVGEVVEDLPRSRVVIESGPEEVVVRLLPPPAESRLLLPGVYGFGVPTYDRVDGLSLTWGAGIRVWPENSTVVRGWGTFHTARGDLDGGVRLETGVGGGVKVALEVAEATRTNETWIRGPLANSLSAIAVGEDVRNYFASRYVRLEAERPPQQALLAGELALVPKAGLLLSRDRSLETQEPWSLFGQLERPNPFVAEGTITSVTAGLAVLWKGLSSELTAEAGIEHALPEWGDFRFTRWEAEAKWKMQALWDHSLEVYARGMAPIGDDPAPPQRWTFVGGTTTLPTFDLAAFRGDHLLFVESEYDIPLHFLTLPLLGAPTLELSHAIGMAWIGDDRPPLEQNLSVGLEFFVVQLSLYFDPARISAPDPSVSLRLPF